MKRIKITWSKGSYFKLFGILALFALPTLGLYAYAALYNNGSSPSGVEVVYPAKNFSDGQAQFFEYETYQGDKVLYFIVRDNDGVIRAALDACRVCWTDGRGLYQQGDAMVCRKCERRFPINAMNQPSPDCNLAPLPIKLAGDRVIIDAKDLAEGRKYFAISGSGIAGPQCGSGCGGCGAGGGGGGGTKAPAAKGGCCPS